MSGNGNGTNILQLAQESDAVSGIRSALERTLFVAAKDTARGEELDEVTAAVRRALDEAERFVRGRNRRGRRWPMMVDEIYRRAHDPWIALRLSATELVSVRLGSYVSIIGPEGSGKSSFALQLLMQHERDVGPAVYVTPELDADEAAARAIGQDRGASWREVLTGKVDRSVVRDRPRFVVLEREDATLPLLVAEVEALKSEYPDEPILVAWDHLQASPGDGDGERMRIARLSTQLRTTAKQLGVVIAGVSQTSREGAKKLTSGELLGAEASRTGAESSQIERDSYAIIAIGDHRKLDDGTEKRSVSVGKNRMGVGDVVYAAIYDGRTGWWRLEGDARPASEIRAERAGKDEEAKLNAVELAMVGGAARANAPLTRDQLRDLAQCNRKLAGVAATRLIARGELVEVRRHPPRSKAWLLWTPDQARAAGIPLVTDPEEA